MQKVFSIIVLFCFVLSSFSQIVFNEVYDIDSSNNGVSRQIELENGNFIVADQSFITGQYNSSFVMKIDDFGDVIWKKNINLFLGNRELVTNLFQKQNVIYAIGVGTDTASNILNSYIYKFNLNGDSIYSKIFTDTLVSASRKIIYKNDCFYLLQWISEQIPYVNVDIRILKIDTLGNIIDDWIYGGNNFDDTYDFKKTDDGGFIIAGSSRSYTIDNNSDFLFIKIDSLGNIEWQNTYGTGNDETIRPYNYIENTKDGGYIMLGEEYVNAITPSYYQAIILKVDSLGNQIKRKELRLMEQTAGMNIRECQDGSLIISGDVTNWDTIIPFFNEPKGYLVKYTADLETEIWSRYIAKYWIEGVDNYVRGMMLTSDDGILITGWVSPTQGTRNDAWVVKFDSCGYTVGDVPTPFFVIDSIEKSKANNKVFITEKSTDYCTAEIDWGDGTENTLYYAYENNLPLAEKQLEHTYTENGEYTIKITTLAGEEYREYETIFLVSSIDSTVGLSTLISEQSTISIFPNPAQDYVIVQNTNSPLGLGVYTSVSNKDPLVPPYKGAKGIYFQANIKNITGKTIKTIYLNSKRYQQQIDISDLANGVYFVSFTVENVQVGVEKIVVAK